MLENKTIDGYVIYHKGHDMYFNDYDFSEDIDDAIVYDSAEVAKEIINGFDYDSDEDFQTYEIHKIKVIYQLEEIQKRSFVWNVVAEEVKSK